MEQNTCCFIGHREIRETKELKERLYKLIESLIVDNGVDTFLFGSKSRFNSVCYETVTGLKEKHPHIKRVYVRAEYPVIDEDYKRYLLKRYEKTYYPEKAVGAGRAVYIKRNFDMIDKSLFCVIYFDSKTEYNTRKSGAGAALNYAKKRERKIYNAYLLSS